MAKCEKDILIGDDNCYCKKHAPEELKEIAKESSFTGKLKRFSFRKK